MKFSDAILMVSVGVAALMALDLLASIAVRGKLQRPRWSKLQTLIYLLTLASVSVLAGTSFYSILEHGKMEGWLLFWHLAGAGAFVVGLTLLAFFFSHVCRFGIAQKGTQSELDALLSKTELPPGPPVSLPAVTKAFSLAEQDSKETGGKTPQPAAEQSADHSAEPETSQAKTDSESESNTESHSDRDAGAPAPSQAPLDQQPAETESAATPESTPSATEPATAQAPAETDSGPSSEPTTAETSGPYELDAPGPSALKPSAPRAAEASATDSTDSPKTTVNQAQQESPQFGVITRLLYWLILLTGVVTAGSMLLGMLPLFGTEDLEQLLDVHRYSGLALTGVLVVHLYRVLLERIGKR